jgi:hypothetical protein
VRLAATDPVADPVADPVERLLRLLQTAPLAPSQIQAGLGLKHRPQRGHARGRVFTPRAVRIRALVSVALDPDLASQLLAALLGTGEVTTEVARQTAGAPSSAAPAGNPGGTPSNAATST